MIYFCYLNSHQKQMSLNKPIWKLRDWIDKSLLNWKLLSKNPNAIKILEENRDKINWISLNSNAIELLEKNFNKIKWSSLSKNPNALHLLEKNQIKID